MFLFLLAFFILCGGVVVARVARGRGRSALGWGLLACVLSFSRVAGPEPTLEAGIREPLSLGMQHSLSAPAPRRDTAVPGARQPAGLS